MFVGWVFFMFTEHGDGFIAERWSWRVVGPEGESKTAGQGFATLVACQAHAAKQGFTSNDRVTVDCPSADKYDRHLPQTGARRAAIS